MTIFLGSVYKNNLGFEAKAIKIMNYRTNSGAKLYKVKFEESGYESITEKDNFIKGRVKDYGRPTVYGVGYSYRGSKSTEKVYKTWSGMIERCYVPDRKWWKYYGGRGVKVSDRWLHLKNFEEDIKELDGYDLFIKDERRVYSLDKDTVGDGLLYSKENCCFITQEEQLQSQDRVVPLQSTSKHGEVEVHKSINQAAIKLGVQNANLYKVLNGERKHTLGYTFKRLNK